MEGSSSDVGDEVERSQVSTIFFRSLNAKSPQEMFSGLRAEPLPHSQKPSFLEAMAGLGVRDGATYGLCVAKTTSCKCSGLPWVPEVLLASSGE